MRKKVRRMVRGLLAGCAVLGWWGALYPQFTMVKGTYDIVYEDSAAPGNMDESAPDGSDVYWKIMGTDCSRIRFRSRLFQKLNALQEQRRGNYESGSQ